MRGVLGDILRHGAETNAPARTDTAMAQIIVRLKDREMQRLPVVRVATRIGRDATNHVVIDNDGVSRHHATLRYDTTERAFVIEDAQSANGIVVRGRRTPDARLRDGDEVQIGKFTLVFLADGGIAPEALVPEDVPEAPLGRGAMRNPLPTTAVRSARPRVASSPAIHAVAPAATRSSPPAPAIASVRPAPAVVSYPPVATAPREEGDGDQTRRLRRVTVLLTVLIGLLGIVIGLLVGRR